MTIQMTRGEKVQSLPLDTIIRDPKENVPLHPGDVVTAMFQPLTFMALGATGKNEEINFETQGITLAPALARTGGLLDNQADAKGVYIFRFEAKDALEWPRQPVATTKDGRVPVAYRLDLKNPASMFVAQDFPMDNKDQMYVTNAPATQIQKFLNLLFSVLYPVLSAKQSFGL
jgi:polysaccharide export outer membrane protein